MLITQPQPAGWVRLGLTLAFAWCADITKACGPCDQGGVLITGGIGALGLLVAQWLAQTPHTSHDTVRQTTGKEINSSSSVSASSYAAPAGASPPDLYLVSRTGRPDAAVLAPNAPLARLLTGSMGLVTITRADVATAEDAAAVLAAAPAALGRQPVTAVVHASGVLKVSKCWYQVFGTG